MKNNIIAVLVAAVVLFFWGFISWAVLPWHNAVANKFTNEAQVIQALKENSPQAGIYYLPFAEEDHKPGQAAGFMNVLPNGFDMNMGKMMGMAIVGQVIAALLVVLLLCHTTGLSYWKRVGFITLTGLTIGYASHFPYWNWFGFSTSYVLVIIADTTIGWFLAGLVMAKLVLGKAEN
jgi:hypothetical protein